MEYIRKTFGHPAGFSEWLHWRWDDTEICFYQPDPLDCVDELRERTGSK